MATGRNKALRLLRTVTLLLTVATSSVACVGAAVNTGTYAVKSASRDELRPLAESGDADAQYELGQSYCCMGPGFDTQTATEWLCRAAKQEDARAMVELGRIYLGDVSRTAAPGQKLLQAVSAREARAIAYVWLSRASISGHENAADRLARLSTRMTPDDLRLAQSLDERWPDVPCEYDEVLGE